MTGIQWPQRTRATADRTRVRFKVYPDECFRLRHSSAEVTLIKDPSTLEPGVDAERRRGGPFIHGKELRDLHLEVASGEEIKNPFQMDMLETSAPDSEKSGPRRDLIKIVEGMQYTLLTLTQGIKRMIRDKAWARKAHARRERRRAEKRQKVGYQPPQFPVDSPRGLQQDDSTTDIGDKQAEEVTQYPKDWESPSQDGNQGGKGVQSREDRQLSESGRINPLPQDSQKGSNL
jgi:hypothetical protein